MHICTYYWTQTQITFICSVSFETDIVPGSSGELLAIAAVAAVSMLQLPADN